MSSVVRIGITVGTGVVCDSIGIIIALTATFNFRAMGELTPSQAVGSAQAVTVGSRLSDQPPTELRKASLRSRSSCKTFCLQPEALVRAPGPRGSR